MKRNHHTFEKLVSILLPLVGLSIGGMFMLGLLGIIDIGITFVIISTFFAKAFVWIIGIAIGFLVVMFFFPGLVIVLIAAILFIVLICIVVLIGSIL